MAVFQVGLGIGTIQLIQLQFDSYLIRFNSIVFHLEIVVHLDYFFYQNSETEIQVFIQSKKRNRK